MSDFHECIVGTFSDELQALIDYGHDCCARIDDRIHECCERIREAHDVEVGSYQMALIWKEEQDAVDAGRCGETSAGGGVPAADKCRADCAVHQLAEEVAPITGELRDAMERYCNFKDENRVQLGEREFDQLCDSIDAVHKGLERENEELRQRTMYPAESERINMLEREVKRLTAECKTQRNNFDQATSAREHWKSLYEQSLEQIHDLEHDVEMWRDRAEDMRMERDDALKEHHAWAPESHYVMLPKDANGKPIHIGDVMDSKVDYLFDGKPFTVCGLVLCEDGWEVTDGRFGNRYEPNSLRHHHAPTVEDVLREFASDIADVLGGDDFRLDDSDELFAEYAAKLRLAEDANA